MPPSLAKLLRISGCLACLAFIVQLSHRVIPINATTAALHMLVVVLAAATRWGLLESIFTSAAGVLVFNYYFLPPVGTFTIADPENWVALAAFLATAVTASKLSDDARRRAQEAQAGRNQMARLYELSRELLMEDGADSVAQSVLRASQILGLASLAFYDAESRSLFGNLPDPARTLPALEHAAATGTGSFAPELAIFPVKMGTRTIGSLALAAPDLETRINPSLGESVANLLAINHQRAIARERATAAEAARRNEEFKAALLDGLAHDLKTPLTAIRTCVTSLISIPNAPEEVTHELLGIIDQGSLRLQTSITEAIELARIESRELRLEKACTPVHQVIGDAFAILGEDGASRCSASLTSPELAVFADPGLLRRALSQVLENACKYSPADSPIVVEVADGGSSTTIAVLDRGSGIHPAELDRIFDKFYRARAVRSKIDGTGMGLAIAKGIIEAHGGKIRAENRQGGGAVVSITLPSAPA